MDKGGGPLDPYTRNSSQCLVCRSKYRVDIERMLRDNKTFREISRWVGKRKIPEKISRFSIQRHNANHSFKILSIKEGEDGQKRVTEEELSSLTDFLDLVIEKVDTAIKTDKLKPTVSEGVKAAEIKGKMKEDSKWEKELLRFFLGVSKAHGISN